MMGERLRKVTESDRELLFTWANDPVTRKQSFQTAPISWENHVSWFRNKMQEPGCHHYIMESGEEPVGVIRLERQAVSGGISIAAEGQCAYEISYSVAPGKRGLGYGKKLLQLAEYRAAAEILDCAFLEGEVKKDNPASRKCFEALGYGRGKKASDLRAEAAVECNLSGEPYCYRKAVDRSGLIYFRADGNACVGYGHVMRCLTIADACLEKGMYPVFLMADHEPEQLVRGRGYSVQVSGTDYRRMEEESEVWEKKLVYKAPVVLDSYFLTERYVRGWRERGFPVLWMDDLGKDRFPVDCLVNYNLYADSLFYPQDGSAVRLLGPEYAPVRPSFSAGEYRIRPRIMRILITTGASDPCGAGYLFAKAMLHAGIRAEVCVVCGQYHPDIGKLERLAEQTEAGRWPTGECIAGRLRIFKGLTDLSGLMRESDLAVAAAGSTLYELCAVGVPALVYYFADNQRMGAEAFAEKTGSLNLGDLRSSKETAAQNACRRIKELQDRTGRETLSRSMRGLTDGKGAGRIADECGKLSEAKGTGKRKWEPERNGCN